MDKRLRGVTYRALLPRLPRNLLVFDGHCLMSQARVRYVLERNFNYFKMTSYFLGDEGDMAEQLDRHRIHLLSWASSEAEELERLLLPKGSTSSTGGTDHPSQELVFLFIEKVPSKSASFLLRKRGRATTGGTPAGASHGVTHTGSSQHADALFQNPTTTDDSYASFSGKNVINKKNPVNLDEATLTTQALRSPAETDLMVSTNFIAMCRVGMHLDRWLVRHVWRALYWCTPRAVGDWWFQRYVIERRGVIWGTSEKDAVATLGIIEGMKERRWSWRTRYPSSR